MVKKRTPWKASLAGLLCGLLPSGPASVAAQVLRPGAAPIQSPLSLRGEGARSAGEGRGLPPLAPLPSLPSLPALSAAPALPSLPSVPALPRRDEHAAPSSGGRAEAPPAAPRSDEDRSSEAGRFYDGARAAKAAVELPEVPALASPSTPAGLGSAPSSDALDGDAASFAAALHAGLLERLPQAGFTVRDFHAWSRFIRHFTPELGRREALVEGARYVYADRLETEGERKVFDGLLAETLQGRTLPEGQGKTGRAPAAAPAPAPAAPDGDAPFGLPLAALIPDRKASALVATPATLKRLEAADRAYALRDFMLMVGPPATIKSALPKYLASEYAIPYMAVTMHPGIGTFELVGGFRPKENRIRDQAEARALLQAGLQAADRSGDLSDLLEVGTKVYGAVGLQALRDKIAADLSAAASADAERRILALAHGLRYGAAQLGWVDGYLTYALKNDIWITFEELNAAPTEALEFLNEFLRSRRLVLTQKLGEPEVLTPRAGGRFMLWATMNPETDSNRNVLAQTLKNRWRVKHFGALPALEQAEILEKRFGVPAVWSLALVENVHMELDRQARHRVLGAEFRDGYEINLRHLLKVARRWQAFKAQKEAAGQKLSEKESLFLLAREAFSVYGGLMRQVGERDGVATLLDQALKLESRGISKESLNPSPTAIEDLGDRVRIGDVELLKGKGGDFVPQSKADYLPDRTVIKRLYEVAKAMAMGEPVLLMGETGAGKTSDLEYLFFKLHRNLRYKNLDSDSAIEEVVGGYVSGQKRGEFRFQEALLPRAMEEGTGAFLDEFNLNPLVEWLNTVVDDGRLYLPHRIVAAAPGFSLVAAANPPESRYEGRVLLSPAVRSRWTEIWVPEDSSFDRLKRLMDHWLKNGLKAVLALAGPAAALATYGPPGLSAAPADRPEKKSPDGAPQGALEALLLSKGIPAGQWPAYRTKLAKVQTLLRMVGASVGRDAGLNFEPGAHWAFYPKTNTITYPFEHLLTHSEAEIVGLMDHEGGHREWTRWPEGSELVRRYSENPLLHFLWNAMEDPRVNNGVIRRLPGAEAYLHAAYDRYLPKDLPAPAPSKGPPKLTLGGDGATAFEPEALRLPHVEYLMAANYYWRHGGPPPRWNNESARKAFEATRASIDRVFAELPEGASPDEKAREAASLRALERIDRDLRPVYETLLAESEKKLAGEKKPGEGQGQESGKGQGSAEGQSEGEGPGEGASGTPTPGGSAKKEKKDGTVAPGETGEAAERRDGDGDGSGEGASDGKASDAAARKAAREALEEHARRAAEQLGGRTKGEKGAPGQEGVRSGDAAPSELGLEDVARTARERREGDKPSDYRSAFREIAAAVSQTVTHLDNIFFKNSRPRDVGHFKSGKRPDIKQVMKRQGEGGLREDYWLRRTQKTKRRYRVTLLIDESGSMAQHKEPALRGAMLLLESLSRLGIDFEVLGFDDKARVHKSFAEPLRPGLGERLHGALSRSIGAGGATHDADALKTALERLVKEEADRRLILVVTDGQGNGPSKVEKVLKEADKDRIEVVGVGLGEGMAYVKESYPRHALVPQVRDLPLALKTALESFIRSHENVRPGP